MRHDIKTLLGKVENKLAKKPSKELLDKLAIFAGFQDWESFREEVKEKEDL